MGKKWFQHQRKRRKQGQLEKNLLGARGLIGRRTSFRKPPARIAWVLGGNFENPGKKRWTTYVGAGRGKTERCLAERRWSSERGKVDRRGGGRVLTKNRALLEVPWLKWKKNGFTRSRRKKGGRMIYPIPNVDKHWRYRKGGPDGESLQGGLGGPRGLTGGLDLACGDQKRVRRGCFLQWRNPSEGKKAGIKRQIRKEKATTVGITKGTYLLTLFI